MGGPTGVVAAALVALVAAAPALADGEGPPPSLSTSSADLIFAGIVVAALAVVAWLLLSHIRATRRGPRGPLRSPDEDAP